ncbi:MAG TPA: 50S ribosomal protein L10 [Cyclobacteriaceae bacterium]|nr:50S ribosomal protein L10 [Chitinophagales bacterium]HNK83553.1 50S ribosomal protein L10 [Cyclobacteriaceae bacterium]HMX04354.1 50S ribosomal protein L10 [Chitinophagales bacterium]HNE45408.1 50S ribosomal protein L10 [Chitinophagales bacterium]HNF69352.1 50S ribosomal protein L10 [Chitinophagales bacterium]
MNKEQKTAVIEELKETVSKYDNFYLTDASAMTVEEVNKLRRMCFENGIRYEVVKNTLLRKAFEAHGVKYEGLFNLLHGETSVMFSESSNQPAKLIKKFRKENDKEKPLLKGAYVGADVFLGDNSLDALISLKSKEELIGEIIGLLQSPAKNVISALLSSEQKLAGIVKTLSEKEEK